MARVFEVDVLRCDQCGGRRKVVAFIPEGTQAQELLERLGIDSTAPPLAKARSRPQQLGWDEADHAA